MARVWHVGPCSSTHAESRVASRQPDTSGRSTAQTCHRLWEQVPQECSTVSRAVIACAPCVTTCECPGKPRDRVTTTSAGQRCSWLISLYGAGMAQPAPRWHGQNSNGDDGETLPPADLYKAAVEEYRFQAQFNWSRTQYLLVFSAGALAAASALLGRSAIGSALVFGLGAIAAISSIFAIRTAHNYYRAARDRMRRVENFVHVPDELRTDTTTSLGGPRRRVSVNQVVTFIFATIAIADIAGVVVALLLTP